MCSIARDDGIAAAHALYASLAPREAAPRRKKYSPAAATIVIAKTVVGSRSMALRDEVATRAPDVFDFEIAVAAFACAPIEIVFAPPHLYRKRTSQSRGSRLSAWRLTVRGRTGEVLGNHV